MFSTMGDEVGGLAERLAAVLAFVRLLSYEIERVYFSNKGLDHS